MNFAGKEKLEIVKVQNFGSEFLARPSPPQAAKCVRTTLRIDHINPFISIPIYMQGTLYDAVNEKNEIVGKATRAEIIKTGLYRRIVHVLLFDKDNRLLIIQRPSTDKAYPNQWTSSVMGHVELGESFEDAANRELKEELGIHIDLKLIGKFPDISIRNGIEHRVIYGLFAGIVKNAAELELDSNEAQSMRWEDIETMREDMTVNSKTYTIPFQRNLHYYLQHNR